MNVSAYNLSICNQNTSLLAVSLKPVIMSLENMVT